jgi:hypothetical protein
MEAIRLEVNRVGEIKKKNITDDEFMDIYKSVVSAELEAMSPIITRS